jgi:2'-5' RNA ligase
MSGPRARMFVALDLPDVARAVITAWRGRLIGDRSDLRLVGAEEGHGRDRHSHLVLHVTLVFLGWQDEAAAQAIGQATFAAAAGIPAPRLAPRGVRALPPRAPRLFALDLADEDGRAGRLQGAVCEALEAGGWHRPERRPFWPHVTLARVGRGARAVPPLAGEPPPAEPFLARGLTLYRSVLRPQGALYEPLARAVLPASDP